MLKHILQIFIATAIFGCGSAGTPQKTADAPRQPGPPTETGETSSENTLNSDRDGLHARGSSYFNAAHPFLTIDSGGNLAKVKELLFTRDGRYLVTAGYDKSVRIYHVQSGRLVRTLRGEIGEGKEGRIYAAALSPDDRNIVIGGWLGDFSGNKYRSDEAAHQIRVIDFYSGEVRHVLKGHLDVVLSLSYSPDGRYILSGSGDSTAKLWNAQSGALRTTLSGHTGAILDTAISPDGRLAATAGDDKTVRLFSIPDGRRIATLRGHSAKVSAVTFADGGRTIVSGDADGEIRIWDGKSGQFVRSLARQNGGVAGLTISADSTRVVTGSSGGTAVNIYSLRENQRVQTFDRHQNVVLATAVSPDNRYAASAGGNRHEIYIWDLDTKAVHRQIVGMGRPTWSVGFARNGSAIAFGTTPDHQPGTPYQMNGPLEQAFRIVAENEYDFGIIPGIPDANDYRTAQENVGKWSVRTLSGREHATLELRKNGRVHKRITRNSATGFDHRAFTLTPKGNLVISGGSNGKLTAYGTESGSVYREYVGHAGDILSVAVSPDGALMVSGSNDQTIRLWHTQTGSLLLTVFVAADNQWVAWTPEGYYASSPYGDRYVGWHINRGADRPADYYRAYVFSKQFRAPSLVAYYLEETGALTTAVQRYRKWLGTEATWTETDYHTLGNFAPPRPVFIRPYQYVSEVNANSIRIKARALGDGDTPIEDIWVLLNGKRVADDGPVKPKSRISKQINGTEATIEVEVPLPETTNRISVVARNRYAESEPGTIEIARKDVQQVEKGDTLYKPNLYVLAIGVSENRDPAYQLDYAHADAESIDQMFRQQSGKLYRSVYTRLITNQTATRSNILDGLEWIYRQTTQRDTAVIFIAGHGLKDDRNNYYFLPYDGDDQALTRTGVKWDEFKNVIENLPAKVILMADTCFSGNITGTHRGPKNTMDDALRDLVNSGTGVVVFTASTGREFGFEHTDWGHGAFTKALVEGLQNRRADYNKDGHVYVKELDLYISERVKALTQGAQHPTTEIPSTMPDFPLYSR
ncbi:MAG: caspase family protein [Deltaproteobacteria bacterium]|nr:caspase family protein [Deltaproteobacteria bacterium]MBN2671892.1 caspase family protein [Deltaproteobacteria bacterium]